MIRMKKYEDLPSSLFIENRKAFAAQMQKGAMAVFHSNDVMPSVGDAHYPFRQNSDFFYLTGIDQEECTLFLFPDAPLEKYREMLFVRRTNETIAVWEGRKYTAAEASSQSGIQNVLMNDQVQSNLSMLMNHCSAIYVNLNENDRAHSDVVYKELRFAHEVRAQFPAHEILRSGPILSALRTVKRDAEIAAIQEACNITEAAFRRVLAFTKPGVYEYEIEAEIIHEFIRKRATGHAYTPIIASGSNACVLHYNDNNKPCQDGDLLLLDFGAEYANYCADLTRTIPVSGTFSTRQKEVYNAVLRIHKQAFQIMKPGITLDALNREVGMIVEEELIQLGLLKADEVKKQNPDQPLYKKYFMHGNSHFLGLDVHDIGNRFAPIPHGAVLTNEPGIYIPEENIGIRIENDIHVLQSGNVDLMKNIPIEADEIEEYMQVAKQAIH